MPRRRGGLCRRELDFDDGDVTNGMGLAAQIARERWPPLHGRDTNCRRDPLTATQRGPPTAVSPPLQPFADEHAAAFCVSAAPACGRQLKYAGRLPSAFIHRIFAAVTSRVSSLSESASSERMPGQQKNRKISKRFGK